MKPSPVGEGGPSKMVDEVSLRFTDVNSLYSILTPHPPQAVPLLPQEKALFSIFQLKFVLLFTFSRFSI